LIYLFDFSQSQKYGFLPPSNSTDNEVIIMKTRSKILASIERTVATESKGDNNSNITVITEMVRTQQPPAKAGGC
jgi:hypothetical protein